GLAVAAVDYLEARALRRRVIAGLAAAFAEGRLAGLVLPATPTTAPLRGTTDVLLESGVLPHRVAQLASPPLSAWRAFPPCAFPSPRPRACRSACRSSPPTAPMLRPSRSPPGSRPADGITHGTTTRDAAFYILCKSAEGRQRGAAANHPGSASA